MTAIKPTVLLFDQSTQHSHLEPIQHTLQQQELQTKTVTTGQQLFQQLRCVEASVVLWYVNTYDENKRRFLHQLRGLYTSTERPLLLLVEEHSSAQEIRALREGINDYLASPFDPKLLLARLDLQFAHLQTEHDLNESEDRYQDLVEHASDLIFGFSPDGTLHFANRSFWAATGYEEPSASLNVHTLITSSYRNQWQELLQYAIEQKQVGPFEISFSSSPHNHRILEGNLNYHRTEHGLVEYQGFFHDITARKKIEGLKNEFVSIVSHELRTPLTSIRGSLGLITGGVTGALNPKTQSLLDIAYNNCERLVRLIDDILNIEKIESGNMEFKMRPQPLHLLLTQAIDANSGFAEEHNVQIELQEPTTTFCVFVDSDRILQVLTNLLSNAIKFSPAGASVTLSAAQHEQLVRISVTDRGEGIPDSYNERIFEKFAQVDASSRRKKGGSGLGLSISKAIVEKHDGQINFTTEPGRTIFYFTLPLWRTTSDVLCLQPSQRVLICEDQKEIAQLLSRLLNRSGYANDIAYRREDMENFLHVNQYSLVTMDLMFNGQHGLRVLEELQEQIPTLEHTPVIVISALANQSRHTVKHSKLKIIDWLNKPFSASELRRKVDNIFLNLPRTSIPQSPAKPILYIAEDTTQRDHLQHRLQHTAPLEHVTSFPESLERLTQTEYSLVILDTEMTEEFHKDWLSRIRSHVNIPVLLLTQVYTSDDVMHYTTTSLLQTNPAQRIWLQTVAALLEHPVSLTQHPPIPNSDQVVPST